MRYSINTPILRCQIIVYRPRYRYYLENFLSLLLQMRKEHFIFFYGTIVFITLVVLLVVTFGTEKNTY